MLFPVSGVEANPVFLFFVAFAISYVTSMGGVSGAFLLLPFQMSILGYTTPSVSATNHLFNVVAIPSGVYRYIREGRMLWPLTLVVIIGTLPGVFIGAWVRIEFLPNPENFKRFAGIILLFVGWRLFLDILQRKNKTPQQKPENLGRFHTVRMMETSFRKIVFGFNQDVYNFSPGWVLLLCFFVGIAGGTYGIGGGAIIAPFLIAIMRLPVHAVAGAALMGTFVTSLAGVVFYHVLARSYPGISISPDWLLGLILGLGGLLGMYLGARTQKFLPPKIIKGILCACVLFIALSYLSGFLLS